MAQVLPTKQINKSVMFLQDVQQNINEAISTRQTQLREQLEQKKTQLIRKRQLLIGQVKDQPLGRLYNLQSQSLDVIHAVVSRIETIAPIGKAPLQAGQAQVKGLLTRLQTKQDNMARPDLKNYDELNVKDVNAQLESLDYYQLLKLRQYEASNKNRVTVLREVDRLLA